MYRTIVKRIRGDYRRCYSFYVKETMGNLDRNTEKTIKGQFLTFQYTFHFGLDFE